MKIVPESVDSWMSLWLLELNTVPELFSIYSFIFANRFPI
jgi:hypothetical protein